MMANVTFFFEKEDLQSFLSIVLHIVPVKASSKNVMEGNLEGIDPNMPPDIQSYYISNNTNVFLFSQPFTKSSTPSTNARNLFRFQVNKKQFLSFCQIFKTFFFLSKG